MYKVRLYVVATIEEPDGKIIPANEIWSPILLSTVTVKDGQRWSFGLPWNMIRKAGQKLGAYDDATLMPDAWVELCRAVGEWMESYGF